MCASRVRCPFTILSLRLQLIDEFEDVTIEEKEFMKLWNRHVHSYRSVCPLLVAAHVPSLTPLVPPRSVYSDASMPSVCVEFARAVGPVLVRHGLRHNFVLHLLNLWDNALINTQLISQCIDIVDGRRG